MTDAERKAHLRKLEEVAGEQLALFANDLVPSLFDRPAFYEEPDSETKPPTPPLAEPLAVRGV